MLIVELIFMYLKYILMVIISVPLNILAFLLAPILPFFATNQLGPIDNGSAVGIGPRLPKWLNWFMTPDNSLDGDYGWKTEHWQWRFNYPWFSNYLGQVGWLIRNPLYSFGLTIIDGRYGAAWFGDRTIRDNDNAKAGWCYVETDNLFQFVYIKKIPFVARCIYINLGWNIRALVDTNVKGLTKEYSATFVFSPRISGFR